MATQQEIEIIYKSFAEAEETCTVPWVLNYAQHLPGTGLKLHQLFMILGGATGIINLSIALYLLQGHLRYFTKPAEQRQCNRVILFVIILTLTTFFSIVFYNASGYIAPGGQYYEGFAIIGLFLLYVQLVTPDPSTRDQLYQNLEHRLLNGRPGPNIGSLSWFRRVWLMVFQIALTRVGTVVAAEAIFGSTCPLSIHRRHGYIAITTVQGISTGIAVWGVLIFEHRMRQHLKGHRSFLKLLSFKGVVLLQAVQEAVFSVLAEKSVFFPVPPYYISYNDFAKGLPALIFIWELTIVALMFLKTFGFNRYRSEVRNGAPIAANPVRALLSSLSPADIANGLVYAFMTLSVARSKEAKNGAFATHADKHEYDAVGGLNEAGHEDIGHEMNRRLE